MHHPTDDNLAAACVQDPIAAWRLANDALATGEGDVFGIWLAHFAGRFADVQPDRPALLLWDAIQQARNRGTLDRWNLAQLDQERRAWRRWLIESSGSNILLEHRIYGEWEQALRLVDGAFAVAAAAVCCAGLPSGHSSIDSLAESLHRAVEAYGSFWADAQIVAGLTLQAAQPITAVAEEWGALIDAPLADANFQGDKEGHRHAVRVGQLMTACALRRLFGVYPPQRQRQAMMVFATIGVYQDESSFDWQLG